MNILKIYENDLKTSEEIEIMLEIDLDNIDFLRVIKNQYYNKNGK